MALTLGLKPASNRRLDAPAIASCSTLSIQHDPMDVLVVHLPSAAFQLGSNPSPPVGGHVQGDFLNLIPQIHVAIFGYRFIPAPVRARPAYAGCLAHADDRHGRFPVSFFGKLLVDGAVPMSVCSIRASSIRCKRRFKKSISRVCWPIFRPSSATRPLRPSASRVLETPGASPRGTPAANGAARWHSPRKRGRPRPAKAHFQAAHRRLLELLRELPSRQTHGSRLVGTCWDHLNRRPAFCTIDDQACMKRDA